MIRALAFALLWLAACSGFGADADADEAGQQVLVMLRLPPRHFGAGDGYAGGYGDGMGRSARRGIAMRLAREHGLALAGDWPLPLLGVDCYVMAVPAGRSPERTAEALARDSQVAWAQAAHLYRARSHNDALYAAQPAAHDWRLADLHDIATGRGIRVAVIDSGVDAAHPDLAGQIEVAENFVDGRPAIAELHGTAVAGIIGARADDGIGIAGVAPGARLMALRACWQAAADATLCTSLSLAKALHFAIAQGAAVINLSLGGPHDRLLAGLIDAALARGIAVVAASDPAQRDGGFPASHRGVIAVADGAPMPAGAVIAPGHDVPTTAAGARWVVVSGSSYAAAHVAGLFALLRELRESVAASSLALLPDGGIDACATLLRAAGAGACGAARPTPALARRQ